MAEEQQQAKNQNTGNPEQQSKANKNQWLKIYLNVSARHPRNVLMHE